MRAAAILIASIGFTFAASADDIVFHSMEGANANLPFSAAVEAGGFVFASGQIGDKDGKLVEGGMAAEARQAMENTKAALARAGVGMDRVVKCTVFLADISEWADFNKVYVTYFPGNKPARSAFGANGLAMGAKVELECIAKK
ncbi:RidA family protein [Gimibacter soli]|uniref:RidA family protein n=1 Tax=Gimibacter soli TaxID=3024400 RepID=A0AAF0BMC4_9PROT|nr:RidA family protein [Gimibacter soli]WCL54331.1 RidA family protein [Gimibacter soli]